jgi:hypothetical protein
VCASAWCATGPLMRRPPSPPDRPTSMRRAPLAS